MPGPARVVVGDANVLINLCHVNHLAILERLSGFSFEISDDVDAEIIHADHRRKIDDLFSRGLVQRASLASVAELATYADLRTVMGSGEASCIAIAESRGWLLASDERRAFLREVRGRLGEGRLVTTPGLFVMAIRAGLLTVADADDAKRALENHRFIMRFTSFAELIGS